MNVEPGPWAGTPSEHSHGGQRGLTEDSAVIEVVARIVVQRSDLDTVGSRIAREMRTFTELPARSHVAIHVDSEPAEPEPDSRHLTVLPGSRPGPRLKIRVPSRNVVRDGTELDLTRLEFDLLLFLCEHPGRVLRRSELLGKVWRLDSTRSTRTIDVHVRRLRRKLGPGLNLITTVRGVGYRLDKEQEVGIDYGSPRSRGR